MEERPGTAGRRAPPRGASIGSPADSSSAVDRLEHLVGLLEQVAGERCDGSARDPTGTRVAACAPARRSGRARPRRARRSCGIQSAVRWSGSNDRSSSAHATSNTRFVGQAEVVQHDDRLGRRRRPSIDELDVGQDRARCRTARPTSGPRSPAASTANRWPSTRRTPAASGSTPSRAQARSRNDSAGTTSTSTRSSARSSSTVRSATSGEPGHRVEHLAVARRRRATSVVDDAARRPSSSDALALVDARRSVVASATDGGRRVASRADEARAGCARSRRRACGGDAARARPDRARRRRPAPAVMTYPPVVATCDPLLVSCKPVGDDDCSATGSNGRTGGRPSTSALARASFRTLLKPVVGVGQDPLQHERLRRRRTSASFVLEHLDDVVAELRLDGIRDLRLRASRTARPRTRAR